MKVVHVVEKKDNASETFIRSVILLSNSTTVIELLSEKYGISKIQLQVMYLLGGLIPLRYLPGPSRILKDIESCGADLIHCHFLSVGRFCESLLRYKSSSQKTLVSCHGSDVNVLISKPFFYKFGLRRMNNPKFNFTVPSIFLENQLIKLGIEIKPKILNNFIDPQNLKSLSVEKKIDFIIVGRFIEVKGHTYLLKALKRLQSLGVTPRVAIVGFGPLETKYLKFIQDNKLTEVTIVGKLTHLQVLEIISSARWLVQPSVHSSNGSIENSPLTIIEALGIGVPIIASNIGGMPELIEDFKTGLLVREKDEYDLADKMCQAMSLDERQYDNMSKDCKKTFYLRHSSEVVAESLKTTYENIVS